MLRKSLWLTLAAVVVGIAIIAGLSLRQPQSTFSQYPGFAEYLAANPPSGQPPTEDERALLERFRPRIFIADGNDAPIGFYEDYIASGRLARLDGELISDDVTRAVLNASKNDPDVVFTHVPDRARPSEPVALGRVDRIGMRLGTRTRTLTLLTYNFVFRQSGLPAQLPLWLEAPVQLFDIGRDWHQLDHYTAATIVLGEEMMPVALMLQQHNYNRTYLFGETATLPDDGRVRLDIAKRSNELYPHEPERRVHKAVRFMTPGSFRYMLEAGGRPLLAGDDVTDPVREVDYRTDFLPPSDAFYTFEGFLGARRRLPGRSGPPGAFYNVPPALKPWRLQLLSGYWRPGNDGDILRFETAITTSSDPAAFASAQFPVFSANFLCAMRWGRDCAFQ